MTHKKLRILRFDPSAANCREEVFTVAMQPGDTVLQALIDIYDRQDSTLAFRYSCRYNRCGLCGVSVDGRPRLACKTKLDRVDEVAPLAGLPLLRDLAVDRGSYFKKLSGLSLYPVGALDNMLGTLREDPLHRNLMSCLECLCCVSSCPEHDFKDSSFAGPYLYIKLAQLHLDTRDTADRRAQAVEWGIKRCAGCMLCSCPNGINLHGALASLMS
ncbi:MAG: 4Fe-4S dicluster domain-containing protein [Dethiobacter sp.]|jgi:succinate dehydrogenase/fumarate reductase iron-sulfur protein|nr:4Fe-4S dicluster domain-containing protein [Dethiobacter sp.]